MEGKSSPTTLREFAVVGFGRAYVDEIIDAEVSWLEQAGISKGRGLECAASRLDVLADGHVSEKFPGGSVANTMDMLALLGLRVGLFAKFADDAGGALLATACDKRGVALLCDPRAGVRAATARCLVFVCGEGRDRRFAFNNGCADDLSLSDIDAFDFSRTRLLLIEGLLLQGQCADVIVEAMRRAKPHCAIAVTLHGTQDWSCHTVAFRALASWADIICGNLEEQQVLAQAEAHASPIAASEVVTTMGDAGAILELRGERFQSEGSILGADEIEDTVGAGDAFLAGYLAAVVECDDPQVRLEKGAAAASKVLRVTGGRLPRSRVVE